MYSVNILFTSGTSVISIIITIVVEGRSLIPAFFPVRVPKYSLFRFYIH